MSGPSDDNLKLPSILVSCDTLAYIILGGQGPLVRYQPSHTRIQVHQATYINIAKYTQLKRVKPLTQMEHSVSFAFLGDGVYFVSMDILRLLLYLY